MISVGELLENERCKAGISREKLANGVCNQQTLYRALVDKSDISVWVFEILLERLKHSTDLLEYVLSQKEYERILMRDSIEEAVVFGDIEAARILLERYIDDCDENAETDKMYYNRMMSAFFLCGGQSKEDYEEGRRYIEKAIKITLPSISIDNYDSYLFSTYEVENILMYIEAICLLGDVKKGSKLLVECYEYIVKIWTMNSMLVRIIPKCVYLMLKYGEEIILDEDMARYCESALNYLREEAVLYLLMPIMNKTIEIYKRLGNMERVGYWEKYYALLMGLSTDFSMRIKEIPIFCRWKRATYYIDYEVIKGERLNQGMKQEELAEGIYGNPASVSNVEKGKQTPNKTKYKQLCEKLLLDKPRYSGFIIADDFEKIERVAYIRKKLSMGNVKEVLEFVELEKSQSNLERRILESYKMIAKWELGELEKEKAFDEISDVIEEIYPLRKEKYDRRPFRGELDIILAYTAVLNGVNPVEGFTLSKRLIEVNKETKIVKQYNYRNLMSSYIAYMKAASRIEEGEADDNIFNEGVQLCFEQGIGGALIPLFWSKGLQIKNTIGILNSEKYLRYGYLLAELFMNKSEKIKRQYYEEAFDESR